MFIVIIKTKKMICKHFTLTIFRSTSHHQFTQEDRNIAEAQHEAMTDRCKEVINREPAVKVYFSVSEALPADFIQCSETISEKYCFKNKTKIKEEILTTMM